MKAERNSEGFPLQSFEQHIFLDGCWSNGSPKGWVMLILSRDTPFHTGRSKRPFLR